VRGCEGVDAGHDVRTTIGSALMENGDGRHVDDVENGDGRHVDDV